MAVKNDNEAFFVPLCLRARNGPAMTGRFCTAVSKMRVSGVQNGDGVVPSVSDGGSKLLSRSENATPESILHMAVKNVQNDKIVIC